MSATDRDRGLSTTASLLVVFLGLYVAMAPFYTAADTAFERTRDALAAQQDRAAAIVGTNMTITSATWDLNDSDLTIQIENTGERTLDVARLDTVVDGTYLGFEDYERVEVEGVDTEIWRPGEVLTLEDEDTVLHFLTTPDRVKLISGPGVAAAAEVTSL